MSLMSRLISRLAGLPPSETYDIMVERNLKVPMPDGVTLLADHYAPRNLGPRPTVMTRSVYMDRTRGGFWSRLLAERGFNVLVVSGRGTFGSGGEMDPFRQEHDDGLAVLAWLKQQNWFNGILGTYGSSYLGYTQWAIARDAGPILRAMSTQLIGSDLRSFVYPGEAFALELFLFWMSIIDVQQKTFLEYSHNMLGAARRRRAAWHLPLTELDEMTTGKRYRFWREWLEHYLPEDRWWMPGDHSRTVSEVAAPNHLVGGWYDFNLPSMIRDYQALAKAGRNPYLTVGPWTHFDARGGLTGSREGMIWLRAHLLGDRRLLRQSPVRIFVMGANKWRDLPSYPPPGTRERLWYLQPQGRLATSTPPESPPDEYSYNPATPTPSVGGVVTYGTGRAIKDNRKLEARRDVLTYTSAKLDRDVEVIGPISAELFVRSSRQHTDFFVRLCDVLPSGKSLNVCDGLQRLFPGRSAPVPDGSLKVIVNLWPTAYRFRSGHRMRIQVSSGAFPRYARNRGSTHSVAMATEMNVARQGVYHDPEHPSAVILPFKE